MRKFCLFFATILWLVSATTAQQSETVTLRFSGKDAPGNNLRLDRVMIKNVTRNWTDMIESPDTTYVLTIGSPTGIMESTAGAFGITNLRPNPFNGTTRFDLVVPQSGDIRLHITDINGKYVTGLNENLAAGVYDYEVNLTLPATYILTALDGHNTSTAKLVNLGGSGNASIKCVGRTDVDMTLQTKKQSSNTFQRGDMMEYIGYADYGGQRTSPAVRQAQEGDDDIDLQFNIITNELNDTACDSYEWDGQTYTESGDYMRTFSTSTCDSIVTLHLIINASATYDFIGAICEGDSIMWHDNAYKEAGDHVWTFEGEAANGCDSVVTLHLAKTECELFTVGDIDFYMVTIPGGEFEMGGTDDDNQPVHNVGVSTFGIGKSEVTQALWKAVTGENPSRFDVDSTLPVEMVSYDDITGDDGFLKKLNDSLKDRLDELSKYFALPSEAQWEYAAKGGNVSQGFAYAGSNIVDSVAWYIGNSGEETHPVMGKNYNELGLYDMSGNVWEWCSDWYGSYDATESDDEPAEPTERVCRGGGYMSPVGSCLTTRRNSTTPDQRSINIGLRLALLNKGKVTHEIYDTACESYTWYDHTYTESGEYTHTIPFAYNCDSLIRLHLTIKESPRIDTAIIVCGEFAIGPNMEIRRTSDGQIVEGETLAEPGEYDFAERLGTAENGCDTIVSVHLTLKPPIAPTDTTVTANDSYTWNDVTYSSSGDYSQTFPTESGCDSVVYLHLIINNPEPEPDPAPDCDGEAYLLKQNGDTTCYATLELANTAAQSGDTIKLLRDVTLEARLELKAGVTLKGEGKTIYANTGSTYFPSGSGRDILVSFGANCVVLNTIFDGNNKSKGVQTWEARNITLYKVKVQKSIGSGIHVAGGEINACNITIGQHNSNFASIDVDPGSSTEHSTFRLYGNNNVFNETNRQIQCDKWNTNQSKVTVEIKNYNTTEENIGGIFGIGAKHLWTIDATPVREHIVFLPNGGSGSMADVAVGEHHGSSYEVTLPACGFTAPTGKEFAGWQVYGSDVVIGAGENVYGNVDPTNTSSTWQDDLILVATWADAEP